MNQDRSVAAAFHSHVFLGEGHQASERKTWAMIALLIGYEAVARLFAPTPIRFAEAIPIAVLGLAVNIASAWLLSGDEHHHAGHNHGHGNGHSREHDVVRHGHDESKRIETRNGVVILEVFEDGVPPRFRLTSESGPVLSAQAVSVETLRPDGARQVFAFADRGGYLESFDEIPEPHEFSAHVTIDGETRTVTFREHEHARDAVARDNNMRGAFLHVIGDAAVSVMVIAGLVPARAFGWLWMDPVAGIIGALVIANWALALIRDTSAILLDMNPDRRMADNLRRTIEGEGDTVADLHVWRLGPGHLGAIVSVLTGSARSEADYRARLARFPSLSHLTIEVRRAG
jgi:cation diffusion facilitator family transporter